MPEETTPSDETFVYAEGEQKAREQFERLLPGRILAGRYRIVSRLGHGAMGEVWRADDLRLGQPVALKFLPSYIVADDRTHDRMVSELRIGRQVSHPNVCRLYDLVEADGEAFISMEMVEGEDLDMLLARIGRLSDEKSAALAHDIASGLAAAHDLGVLHRDLKPANVMIDSRGRARITDFGLALSVDQVQGRETAGTPAYMAPEQLRGEPATQRTDLYSFGVLVFEMVTGRRMFDGISFKDVERQHREPKPRPSDVRTAIDHELEQLILWCTEEEPEKRPRNAHEVVERLPRPGGSRNERRPSTRETSSSSQRDARSIAVLPFENIGDDNAEGYLAFGLAEEIISDLAKVRELRVIARSSVMRFATSRDLAAVARDLQVRFLLTGAVQKSGNQLRVTANLVDGRTEEIIWSEKFKGTLDDVFDIQEQVARTVATQLKGELSADEQRKLAERPIPNALAYDYYLRARDETWKFTREGVDRAIELLTLGLKIVGENPLMLTALSWAHWQYHNAGIRSEERDLEKAEELALKVLALDPTGPHGHRMLGMIGISRGDVRTAIVSFQRAIERDANDAEALVWLAMISSAAGLLDIAEPAMKRVSAIDPFGAQSEFAPFFVATVAGRVADVIEMAQRKVDADPTSTIFRFGLTWGLLLLGKPDEALATAEAMSTSLPGLIARFMARAAKGDRAVAMQLMTPEFVSATWSDLEYSLHVAEGLAVLGDTDEALRWLDNAIGLNFVAAEFLSDHDTMLAPLRDDIRFEALISEAAQKSRELLRELKENSNERLRRETAL